MAVLHYLDGLTLEEVAAAVGLSVSGCESAQEPATRPREMTDD